MTEYLSDFFGAYQIIILAVLWFVPRRIKKNFAGKILKVAQVSKSVSWDRWIRRAVRLSRLAMHKLYGPISLPGHCMVCRYFTRAGFLVSARMASVYLMFGFPLVGFLYLVVDGGSGVKLEGRGMALMFSVAVAWAVYVEFRRSRFSVRQTDRYLLTFKGLVFGAVFPMFVVISPFSSEMLGKGAMFGLFAVVVIVSLLVFYRVAIGSLLSLYGVYFPVGAFLVGFVSVPVYFYVNKIGGAMPWSLSASVGRRGDVPFWVVICLFFIVASCFVGSGSRWVKWLRGASLVSLLGLISGFLLQIYPLYKTGVLFEVDGNGFTPIGYYFPVAVLLLSVSSLVYANAVCDWLSSGVTRLLLMYMSRTRGVIELMGLLVVDLVLAVALMVMTYIIFSSLVRVTFSVANFPSGRFLEGLMDVSVFEATYDLGGGLGGFLYKFGVVVRKFVYVFSLTAMVPTLVHLMVTFIFSVLKIFGPVLEAVSAGFLERYEEAEKDGGSAVLIFYSVFFSAAVVAIACVLYVSYRIAVDGF